MKLEKYLVLNKFLLSLFGVNEISDLREKLKDTKEGFDESGKSYFADILIGLENLKIPQEDILRYDQAIRGYAEKLIKNRRENINLKYFQYLAVLLSEIYLDKYFNHRKEFLTELNFFVDFLNSEITKSEDKINYFSEKDLKKLAYWMATGSGKTLIMHVNYWQFLKYCKDRLDNIILITANEGMSEQHYKEMQLSGVPCRLYTENINSRSLYHNEVLVIDIYKLTKEKKGSGVRIEVDYFEGKNLVFIDEGHKGQATEEKTWKDLREQLGKTGFIFEYSATFGQVIGFKDKDLLEEYSKAIIFDYSYKYFYTDRYGKDFYVYTYEETKSKYTDLILTANLLSFYEQCLLYQIYKKELKEYRIEKPLWAFVGSKVVGRKSSLSKEEEKLISDVLCVVQFLKKVIEDKNFLKENISCVLEGKSRLIKDGKDIFKDRFQHLRENGYSLEDICEKVCNSKKGSLILYEMKSAEGEIGLRIGDGDYFGVINIGDVAGFKKLLLEKAGIEVKSDNISPSLFKKVNEDDSDVTIIIGAKKFIEGWDSWRVSSMGLINIGKGEGPQIIQLFGRGVRLKGKDFSLKRSEENKYQIKALETLNIYGLNADYINSFLEAIRKEEVEFEEIQLPIKFMEEKRWEKLYILETPKNFDFRKEFTPLNIDNEVLNKVKIDIRPRIKFAHGLDVSKTEVEEESISLEDKYLDLLNWEEIYLEMLNYKVSQSYVNLSIDKEILSEIIRGNGYLLYAFLEQITPKSFSDLVSIKEIVILILKCYIDRFYRFRERQAISRDLQTEYLVKDQDNFRNYTVKIPKDKKEEIKKIGQLLSQAQKLYQDDKDFLPRIHFDQHIYTPLLIYKKEKEYIKSVPPQLNEGEAKFIQDLKDYLQSNLNKFKEQEIFVLRNLSKRGVGFFQTSGYYPDFIMWIRKQAKQIIVFIDPKGIRNLEDEKVQLHKNIKELEGKIGKKDITLESFILSVSKFNDIKKAYGYAKKDKKELENEHILFIKDDKDWVEKLFEKLSYSYA